MIYVKDFVVSPKLKSTKYGRLLIDQIGRKGLEIFGENFKGILATSKKEKDEKGLYRNKVLFNSGGIADFS